MKPAQFETLLACIKVERCAATRFGTIVDSDHGVLRAQGLDLAVGSGARFEDYRGAWQPAIVAGFDATGLTLMPLAGSPQVVPGARVAADPLATGIATGNALLGRVIDALGAPIDGRGPVLLAAQPARDRPSNPMNKARIDTALPSGIRAIDGLLTLGRGQRVAIIAGSGVGKSTLLAQLMRGIETEIVVIALVGERAREIVEFVEGHLDAETRCRSVVVAAAADATPVLRLRAVERATAIAESFRDAGNHVLLVVDSLTRVAHAQREIGLALGEPPTVKGYPPSALAIIPKLIERSGGDRHSGGAITALYTILADGDDLDDPVVDTARSITDGHIVLSRTLAEAGVFPAIDIARSLSRIMDDVVSAAHRSDAAEVRRGWALAEDNRDLVMIGAYRAGQDADLDRAMARRAAVLDFVRQAPGERVTMAEARAELTHLVQS